MIMLFELFGLKISISGLKISISGLKIWISGLKISISGLKILIFGLKIWISSQICVFGSFLGSNGPFRLFSHHILCPTGLMKE